MQAAVPVLTRRALLGAALATPLLPGLVLAQSSDASDPQQGASLMKISIAFDNQDFTATLYDNVSARDFASMLPLDITISDFSNNEKIAYLPRKLNDAARGPFPDAAPGDVCYYIPWGNLAFFYGEYESTRDLVRLGRLDGDVQPLLTRGEFPLRIERL
jgi:hypothetical protein